MSTVNKLLQISAMHNRMRFVFDVCITNILFGGVVLPQENLGPISLTPKIINFSMYLRKFVYSKSP